MPVSNNNSLRPRLGHDVRRGIIFSGRGVAINAAIGGNEVQGVCGSAKRVLIPHSHVGACDGYFARYAAVYLARRMRCYLGCGGMYCGRR